MASIKKVPIEKLNPAPYNPRVELKPEDKEYQAIKNSIESFGYLDPIVWNERTGNIVSGHQRYQILKDRGETELEVMVVDFDMDKEKACNLAMNKAVGLWDNAKLDELLEEMTTTEWDMSEFGFDDMPEIDEPTEVVEDEIPEEVETRCKLGDIWKLGKHRLMCGNSTDKASVERLMDGQRADMVFTDSPYGINAVGDNGEVGANFGIAKKGKYKKIIADDTTETAQQAYDIYSQLCDKIILWGGNYFIDFLPASDGWLIWDKRGESGIRNTFADGEMAWCSFHTPIRIYHQLWNGMIREGEHEKRVHPTQKPIKMLSEILEDFSKENEVILDVFGGSGSTLIACEQLNRKCFMMELDPHYCDVIIQRWENLTGQKAIKEVN